MRVATNFTFFFYSNIHFTPSLSLFIMRHWTLLAASSLILCNFLADAVPTPTEQDIATLKSRRINNIIDMGESSIENVNTWYEKDLIRPIIWRKQHADILECV